MGKEYKAASKIQNKTYIFKARRPPEQSRRKSWCRHDNFVVVKPGSRIAAGAVQAQSRWPDTGDMRGDVAISDQTERRRGGGSDRSDQAGL